MLTANFGPLTLSNSGVQSYSGFGFQPQALRFKVGAKNGSSSVIQFASGSVDTGGTQAVHSSYGDSTGYKQIRSTSKCVSVYERVGGTITEVLSASFDSFTADGFKLNVITPNISYKVDVEAEA